MEDFYFSVVVFIKLKFISGKNFSPPKVMPRFLKMSIEKKVFPSPIDFYFYLTTKGVQTSMSGRHDCQFSYFYDVNLHKINSWNFYTFQSTKNFNKFYRNFGFESIAAPLKNFWFFFSRRLISWGILWRIQEKKNEFFMKFVKQNNITPAFLNRFSWILHNIPHKMSRLEKKSKIV